MLLTTVTTNIFVALVAPTGGTPAGKGFVTIVIDCFNK